MKTNIKIFFTLATLILNVSLVLSQQKSYIGQFKESTIITCNNYKFEIYNQTSAKWSLETPLWWGIVTNDFITAASDGRLYNVDDPDEVVEYDYKGRVSDIGRVQISYDYKGRVSDIGRVQISYDYKGRVSDIGRVQISYDHKGRVSDIGRISFDYNRDGRLIEIHNRGTQEIFYDSEGKYRGRKLYNGGPKCSNEFTMN